MDELESLKQAIETFRETLIFLVEQEKIRGEEVSEDAINSDYFVGYGFKKNLLTVQQAILCYLLDKKL